MGGRGSAAGLNKGGGIETRQLTSIANAPASAFTKNKMMSKTNSNTPASEAQVLKINKLVKEKKENLTSEISAFRNSIKEAKEYRNGEGKDKPSSTKYKNATEHAKSTARFFGKERYSSLKNNIKTLSKAKRSKYATEIIDLLNEI